MTPVSLLPSSPQDGELALYRGALWQFEAGFPHSVAALDIDDALMIAVDGGSWNRYGVQLYRFLVASGQSNLNEHDVEPMPRNPRVALFDGTKLVPLKEGIDNPATRAAELLSERDGIPTILIYDNQGNTKIEAWIGQDTNLDMFARLTAKTNAFEALFNKPPRADAFIWLHGGSNDFDKIVTPDAGYPAKYRQLQERLLAENFCTADTLFFTGEIAANGITDTVNIAQQVMKVSGEFHNYNVVPYRYRSTFDRFHFDEQTIDAESLANAIRAGGSDYFNGIIDRPIKATLDYFGGNLVRAIRFFEQFTFVGDGALEFVETQNREFADSHNITGLNTANVTLDGGGFEWSFPSGHGILCNSNFTISRLSIKGGPVDRRFGVVGYSGHIQFNDVTVSGFTGDRSQSVNITKNAFASGTKFREFGNTRGISKARSDFTVFEST